MHLLTQGRIKLLGAPMPKAFGGALLTQGHWQSCYSICRRRP